MANKIDNVVDNITTALGGLVTVGAIKSVKRCVLVPATVHSPPAVGLVVDRVWRETTTWFAELLLMLVANKGGVTVDERITELLAAVDGVICTLIAGGKSGGSIDKPMWDIWYSIGNADSGWSQVGALATLRIRVQDPLAIT